MTNQRWWAISSLLVAVSFLLGADQTTFKSVKARDAKGGYEDAIKKAEVEYGEKVLAAKKSYRARLEAAKAAVMQTGDLDEANKLEAEIKKLNQEIKDKSTSRGLVIRKVMHGIGEQWADVTDVVRDHSSNDTLGLDGLPDPAFGKSKTTIVEGTYGGREFVLSFNDGGGDPRKTFVFGQPSDNLKIAR